MFAQMHFAVAIEWVSIGIAGLLWFMACAITANKMEQEGVTFWKALVVCFLFTPFLGLIAIGVTRSVRPSRPLVHTVTRG